MGVCTSMRAISPLPSSSPPANRHCPGSRRYYSFQGRWEAKGARARKAVRATPVQCCQTGLGPWFLVAAELPHSLVCMERGKTWGLCFLPALTPLCVAQEQAHHVSPHWVHSLLCRGPRPTCSSYYGPMTVPRLPSDPDRCWKPSGLWDDQGRAFPGLQTA